MSGGTFSRIEQSRFYDRAMRLPIVLYSLYALLHDVIGFFGQVAHEPALWASPDAGVIIAALARVSQWTFLALMTVLPLFRHPPIAKSAALLPRLAALVTVSFRHSACCSIVPRSISDSICWRWRPEFPPASSAPGR